MHQKKRVVTPEKVKKVLAKHGTIVTLEEAREILEFYRKFAKLWLKQVFKS